MKMEKRELVARGIYKQAALRKSLNKSLKRNIKAMEDKLEEIKKLPSSSKFFQGEEKLNVRKSVLVNILKDKEVVSSTPHHTKPLNFFVNNCPSISPINAKNQSNVPQADDSSSESEVKSPTKRPLAQEKTVEDNDSSLVYLGKEVFEFEPGCHVSFQKKKTDQSKSYDSHENTHNKEIESIERNRSLSAGLSSATKNISKKSKIPVKKAMQDDKNYNNLREPSEDRVNTETRVSEEDDINKESDVVATRSKAKKNVKRKKETVTNTSKIRVHMNETLNNKTVQTRQANRKSKEDVSCIDSRQIGSSYATGHVKNKEVLLEFDEPPDLNYLPDTNRDVSKDYSKKSAIHDNDRSKTLVIKINSLSEETIQNLSKREQRYNARLLKRQKNLSVDEINDQTSLVNRTRSQKVAHVPAVVENIEVHSEIAQETNENMETNLHRTPPGFEKTIVQEPMEEELAPQVPPEHVENSPIVQTNKWSLLLSEIHSRKKSLPKVRQTVNREVQTSSRDSIENAIQRIINEGRFSHNNLRPKADGQNRIDNVASISDCSSGAAIELVTDGYVSMKKGNIYDSLPDGHELDDWNWSDSNEPNVNMSCFRSNPWRYENDNTINALKNTTIRPSYDVVRKFVDPRGNIENSDDAIDRSSNRTLKNVDDSPFKAMSRLVPKNSKRISLKTKKRQYFKTIEGVGGKKSYSSRYKENRDENQRVFHHHDDDDDDDDDYDASDNANNIFIGPEDNLLLGIRPLPDVKSFKANTKKAVNKSSKRQSNVTSSHSNSTKKKRKSNSAEAGAFTITQNTRSPLINNEKQHTNIETDEQISPVALLQSPRVGTVPIPPSSPQWSNSKSWTAKSEVHTKMKPSTYAQTDDCTSQISPVALPQSPHVERVPNIASPQWSTSKVKTGKKETSKSKVHKKNKLSTPSTNAQTGDCTSQISAVALPQSPHVETVPKIPSPHWSTSKDKTGKKETAKTKAHKKKKPSSSTVNNVNTDAQADDCTSQVSPVALLQSPHVDTVQNVPSPQLGNTKSKKATTKSESHTKKKLSESVKLKQTDIIHTSISGRPQRTRKPVRHKTDIILDDSIILAKNNPRKYVKTNSKRRKTKSVKLSPKPTTRRRGRQKKNEHKSTTVTTGENNGQCSSPLQMELLVHNSSLNIENNEANDNMPAPKSTGPMSANRIPRNGETTVDSGFMTINGPTNNQQKSHTNNTKSPRRKVPSAKKTPIPSPNNSNILPDDITSAEQLLTNDNTRAVAKSYIIKTVAKDLKTRLSRALEKRSVSRNLYPEPPHNEAPNCNDVDEDLTGTESNYHFMGDEFINFVENNNIYSLKFPNRVPSDSEYKKFDNLEVQETVKDPRNTFSAGFIQIQPGCKKRLNITTKYSFVYNVLNGEGMVQCHNKQSIVKQMEFFVVLRGMEYSIYNKDTEVPLILSYTKIKGTA